MNNTEALNRIAELEKQIAEIKAGIENKEDALWYPKPGADYWFIDSDFEILGSSHDNASMDFNRLEVHNVFQTQEQAERHAKRLKLYHKMWRLAEHLNGDWVPDFEKYQEKYWIYYDTVDSMFRVSNSSRYFQSDACFKNHKLAQRAISMLTDEEKEIFKNIYRA